jgi:tetratricopeptide (TPR) repeat protein
MRNYQSANNPDKTEAMGRKTLSLDGDDPEALVTTAEVIVEKTRDSDIDRDQRYDEAMKMAQKSLTTVDTDISVPAGTTQERLDAYKSGLRSQAYSTMGSIEYSKNNFPASQTNFQKAVDAYPSQPFPADVLRLALALDKQQKYDEALKVANRAVELSPENTPIGTSARHERDRLQQLTGGAPVPAQPAAVQPPKN